MRTRSTLQRHRYVIAFAFVATAGVAGAWLVGENTITRLQSWKQPWFAPSMGLWALVGVSYTILMTVILGRILALPVNRSTLQATGSVGAIVLANEVWNALIALCATPMSGAIALVPFSGLVALSLKVVSKVDRLAGILLAVYLLWLIFDAVWLLALVKLNPGT